MDGHSFVMADRVRGEQFALLGHTCRLFQGHEVWTDSQGITWAVRRVGGQAFAVTWLGPGWAFDPYSRQCWAEKLAARSQEMEKADPVRHRRELANVIKKVRLGGHAERLLWAVHHQGRATRSSVIDLMDKWLARKVWGRDEPDWPRHWRKNLLEILRGLAYVHVAEWPEGAPPPAFGEHTALFTSVGDLRNAPGADVCDGDCPGRHGPAHHHYRVAVGKGFLGLLEQFAGPDDGTGVRTYSFPVSGPKGEGATLRAVGKSGRLVSVYLPAKLGDAAACGRLNPGQHRLLQALVRETTLLREPTTKAPAGAGKGKRRKMQAAKPEVLVGSSIPGFNGRRSRACPALDPQGQHVGFNGNGVRKGQGYRLATEGGWLAKAGYGAAEVPLFLADLAVLGGHLGLIAVGVRPDGRYLDLAQLRALAATPPGRHTLKELHVRVYADADYVERWDEFFGWAASTPTDAGQVEDPALALAADLERLGVSRRALARGLGVDPSFLARVFAGKKPWPGGLLEKACGWLASQDGEVQRLPTPVPQEQALQAEETTVAVAAGGSQAIQAVKTPLLDVALAYLRRGWSVVPQLPGAKKPCVKWKRFQAQLPTEEEWEGWARRWPQAGLALVLGPVSKVLAVDVDGPEAHAALLDRLGEEPVAVKALSGSRKPCRYHLLFQHPDLPTKGKATPWHPKLEFRGHGGIIVIPPSQHKSGHRYEWVAGQSPDDLALPELPAAVLNALKPPPRPARAIKPVAVEGLDRIDCSQTTRKFLAGAFSEGPDWNNRLFRAACDLHARGLPLEEAEPLLLEGAAPWDEQEEETARRTIESAYNQLREPSRY